MTIEQRGYNVRIVVDRLVTPYEAREIAQKILTEADRVVYHPPWMQKKWTEE